MEGTRPSGVFPGKHHRSGARTCHLQCRRVQKLQQYEIHDGSRPLCRWTQCGLFPGNRCDYGGQGWGHVVLFNVTPPGEATYDIDAFLEKALPHLNASNVSFESKYAISRDRLNRIIEESANYDLVIIGASRDPEFRQRVLGSLPEALARRCSVPLIMVKAKHPMQSFIKRWF